MSVNFRIIYVVLPLVIWREKFAVIQITKIKSFNDFFKICLHLIYVESKLSLKIVISFVNSYEDWPKNCRSQYIW